LLGTIILGAAVAAALSIHMLFRMVQPPDAADEVPAAAWVAMPYLAAIALALLFRRGAIALSVLLVALLVAAVVGVSLFDASATQQETARQQAANAVLPGESPDSGPGGMRKAGADAVVFVGGAFSILLVLVLPPVQLAAVAIPAGIGYGISLWLRRRAERRREWELEHTDTRGSGPS
jgi:hypothetical protein